ncbi:hypothetical protein [Candidatus Mesenet endosymbiont of Phosphuga atrata]|uniref:hypothetical protein n=1 Tax=Candidatus Mesenet endosymbiont of Phosphuga atrata TaxID=3066221 RepID=UPI0030CCD3A4
MEGNSGNKKDGYESGYESDLANQVGIEEAAKNLMSRSSELSPEGRNIIGDFAADVFGDTGIYQTPSNQPIYDVPRNRNSSMSRDDTPPPPPSSQPPLTLNSEGEYMYMRRRHSSDSGISSETGSDFQQHFNSGLEILNSNSANKNKISDAVDRAAETVFSPEGQKKLKSKIENDPSFVKEQLTKFNKLSNKDKSLFGLGTFGIAIGAPLAIVALPILATVAAVAGFAIAIIGGLKLATPSKAEFKKTGQGIMHSAKNAADVFPGKTNLEKLWKSTHKPGVTSENPNLEEFLTKYCFPDQEPGKKAEVKFDPDKIAALKYAAKEVGLDLDRMVEKGNSTFKSDYINKDGIDTQFITTIDKIATAVMAKDHLIEGKFEAKLAEVKQAKEEKAAEKKGSFASKFSFSKQSSSYTENVETGRKESNNGLSKG